MSDVEAEYNRLNTIPETPLPGLCGTWYAPAAELEVDAEALAQWADSLPNRIPLRQHKSAAARSAACHDFQGQAVFVKTWEYRGISSQVRQRLRPARGRSCWAMGRALQAGGIHTPAPLGCLELRSPGGWPIRSIYVGEYWPEAVNARHWLRRHLPSCTPDQILDLGEGLLRLWESLRKQQVYHADFKLYNLLARTDASVWSEGFHIIDVDAVRAGVRIGQREILRNLVQLNGSLGGWVPRKIRMDWLARFSESEPWCLEQGIVDSIEKTTGERLRRQLLRIDGP